MAKTTNTKKKKTKKKTKLKTWHKLLIVALAFVLVVVCVRGVLHQRAINALPDAPDDGIPYAVRGVDVSRYQGIIDWETLAGQNLSFAFIKATESSGYVDPRFSYNWSEAQKTNLRIGAYHFMSFETSGEEQAKNFIDTVEAVDGMLPPVVDIEPYGSFSANNLTLDEVDAILEPLLEALEDEYGMTPIIYTNSHFYSSYIASRYDNPIWIADPDLPDYLPDGKDWLFCQYSYEGKLEGYLGIEDNIDLDVFGGTKEEFLDL